LERAAFELERINLEHAAGAIVEGGEPVDPREPEWLISGTCTILGRLFCPASPVERPGDNSA
jgi:hypothetical protein